MEIRRKGHREEGRERRRMSCKWREAGRKGGSNHNERSQCSESQLAVQ